MVEIRRPPQILRPKPTKLVVVKPYPNGDYPPALTLNGPTFGRQITDTEFVQGGSWAALISQVGDTHLGLDMTNCIVRGTPTASNLVKWGRRFYKLGDGSDTSRCEFLDIHQEHAIYESISGGVVTYSNLFFQNIGAQSLQLRLTEKPPQSAPEWLTEKHVHVDHTVSVECGFGLGLGRGGFDLSFKSHGPNSHLYLEEPWAQTVKRPVFDGKGSRSVGALCVEQWATVHGAGGYFSKNRPDRSVVQFYDMPTRGSSPASIEWDGLEVFGGTVHVRVDETPHIRFTHCKGNAQLVLMRWSSQQKKFVVFKTLPWSAGYSQG